MAVAVGKQTIEQQRFGYSDRAHYLSTKGHNHMEQTIAAAQYCMASDNDAHLIDGVLHCEACQTDEQTVANEYLALLTTDELADETDSTEDMVVLYTTNPMGDLPFTIELDAHVGQYNGKTVRALGVPASKVDEQRKSSNDGTRFMCVKESVWHTMHTPVSETMPVADETETETESPEESVVVALPSYPEILLQVLAQHAASMIAVEQRFTSAIATYVPVAPVQPTVDGASVLTSAENAVVVAQSALVAANERLASAGTDLTALMQASQSIQKAAADLLKAQEQLAKARKAYAPVVITEDIQGRIDKVKALVAGGDQVLARAIVQGNMFVRLESDKKGKKDTGTIRKVSEQASSNGVVAIHHNGSSATSVNGMSGKTLSPETLAENDAIKSALQDIANVLGCAWYEVVNMDTTIAKKLGVSGDAKLGSKRVWNLRNRAAQAAKLAS